MNCILVSKLLDACKHADGQKLDNHNVYLRELQSNRFVKSDVHNVLQATHTGMCRMHL